MGLPATAINDENVVIKTVLSECFAGPLVRPWSVIAKHAMTVTIAGYAQQSEQELNARRALALPSLQQSVSQPIGVPLPSFEAGQRLSFYTRIVPTMHVRQGERTITRDAFLVAVDRSPDRTVNREEAYVEYLKERLTGAEVEKATLSNFKLSPVARRHAKSEAGWRLHTAPIAELTGILNVTDALAFGAAIADGIGRQRAYGYGMLLLRPPQKA